MESTSIRIPTALLRKLDREAERERRNRSAQLRVILEERYGRDEEANRETDD